MIVMLIPDSISSRLQYQHESIPALITELSEAEIRMAVQPGKWSIYENLVHLEVYQYSFIDRLRQMLDDNSPAFERYTADTDPLFHDHCGKPTKEIINGLMATRQEILKVIFSLSATDLSQTGVHPVFGEMNIVQWLEFFLLHEAHHLFTIFKFGAVMKKAIL